MLVVVLLAACGGGGKSYPNWDAMTAWQNAEHPGGKALTRDFVENNWKTEVKNCDNLDQEKFTARSGIAGSTDPAIQGNQTPEQKTRAVHDWIGIPYFLCGPKVAEAIVRDVFDGAAELELLDWVQHTLPTFED